MIGALAGRRIDAPGVALPRFPIDRVEAVENRIREALEADKIEILVCAAACGADLLALSAAAKLGVRRRVVLPFSIDLFRDRSVTDRPGPYPWGALYDRFVQEARSSDDLELLSLHPDDPVAYERTNEVILDDALSLATSRGDGTEALAVWDESLRTEHDYTEQFMLAAVRRGLAVRSIGIFGSG
jgi:hypothetical protein